MLSFNADGQEGLIVGKAWGLPPKLNPAQRQALPELVEQGPIPSIHGVVRWRLVDLAQWLWDEYRVSVNQSTVSRELKALGFVTMPSRPRHQAQNAFVVADFKKTSPPRWRKSAPGSRAIPT